MISIWFWLCIDAYSWWSASRARSKNEECTYIRKCFDDVAQAKRMFLLLRKAVRCFAIHCVWCGGIIVRSFDSWLRDCGFDSWKFHFVTGSFDAALCREENVRQFNNAEYLHLFTKHCVQHKLCRRYNRNMCSINPLAAHPFSMTSSGRISVLQTLMSVLPGDKATSSAYRPRWNTWRAYDVTGWALVHANWHIVQSSCHVGQQK